MRVRIGDNDAVGKWLLRRFERFTLPERLPRSEPWTEYSIRRVRRGEYFACRCRFGRFHSTFTGLRRNIRGRLLADGQQCVEVDVSCCQPLLLAGLVVRGDQSGDAKDFLLLCEAGTLYNAILDGCDGLTLASLVPPGKRKWWFSDRQLRRADVKRALMLLLFAPIEMHRASPLWTIVSRRWPTVAGFVEHAKRDDYRAMAHRLQRTESGLMIDGVCGRLMRESPDMPLLTVHDAIAVRDADADVVASVIRDEFTRFGVCPTVRHK